MINMPHSGTPCRYLPQSKGIFWHFKVLIRPLDLAVFLPRVAVIGSTPYKKVRRKRKKKMKKKTKKKKSLTT